MFRVRMKELREESGYKSQQSFADAFGIRQSTVGNWEAGKRVPSVETAINLASFFGTTLDYLFGVTNDRGSKPTGGDTDFTQNEMEIVFAYRCADERARQMVDLALEPYIPPVQSREAM